MLIGTYVLSAGYYDAYYIKAQKVRTLIKRDFEEAFQKVDVLLTPTTPGPAFGIGEVSGDPIQMYLNDIFTVTANMAGRARHLGAGGALLGRHAAGPAADRPAVRRGDAVPRRPGHRGCGGAVSRAGALVGLRLAQPARVAKRGVLRDLGVAASSARHRVGGKLRVSRIGLYRQILMAGVHPVSGYCTLPAWGRGDIEHSSGTPRTCPASGDPVRPQCVFVVWRHRDFCRHRLFLGGAARPSSAHRARGRGCVLARLGDRRRRPHRIGAGCARAGGDWRGAGDHCRQSDGR